MKRLLLPALISLFYLSSFSQTATQKTTAGGDYAYYITAKFTPFKNNWLYLATYYGKNKVLIDSAWLNEQSQCVFKGKTKLTPGIYFFAENRVQLFDFLVDESQHFSLSADSSNAASLTITGSPENTLFINYTRYLGTIVPKMEEVQVKLKNPNLTKQASDTLQAQLAGYNKQLNTYRENLVKLHPQSLMAMLFQAMAMPEVPTKLPKLANGMSDSTYPYRYFKAHYWDNVEFNDARLLHTPIFDPKLENYLKYYVSPDPDSIIKEVNYMLLYARTSKDMFQYLLGRFTDKYISPEIMGQDRVFVFLFENFFLKGDTTWLNATQKKFIFDRGYSLLLSQIGDAAPALDLVDTAGKPVSLYEVKAPLTFILFWDPTCSHCKEQVPEVDSIYEAKWKREGVKVFAVNINDATLGEWKTFIKDQHLNGWVHAYQTKEEQDAQAKAGVANFRQLYDVFQTPTMYLVDANKHIIAKRLSLLQFDGIIDTKLKQTASSTK